MSDLATAIYEKRREQMVFHLKGRDEALKSYLIVAAALGAASQVDAVGPPALLAIPLVALGMALSFAFHHIYLGVIVSYLGTDFADKVPELRGLNWDESAAHKEALELLRNLTVFGAVLVMFPSSIIAFMLGMEEASSTIRDNELVWAYGWFSCLASPVILIGSYLYRRAFEKEIKAMRPQGGGQPTTTTPAPHARTQGVR